MTIQRVFGVALRARAQSPPLRAATAQSETFRKQLDDLELESIFEQLNIAGVINMGMLKKMDMPTVCRHRPPLRAARRAASAAEYTALQAFRARRQQDEDRRRAFARARRAAVLAARAQGAPRTVYAPPQERSRAWCMLVDLVIMIIEVNGGHDSDEDGAAPLALADKRDGFASFLKENGLEDKLQLLIDGGIETHSALRRFTPAELAKKCKLDLSRWESYELRALHTLCFKEASGVSTAP